MKDFVLMGGTIRAPEASCPLVPHLDPGCPSAQLCVQLLIM